MPKKKLPDGRVISEPAIDLEPPPIGNVDWIAKRKPIIVKAFTQKEARQKAADQLKCKKSNVTVELLSKSIDSVEPSDWTVESKTETKVNAHTYFDARAKAVIALECDVSQVTLEQAPESTDAANIKTQESHKPFDPWAKLRKSVKRARARGNYR